MVETKREISLDPMIVSAWRARGHHVGVCADWLHNPVRENGKLRPFVHPWCTARERGAKGSSRTQGKCATRLHCQNSFGDWGADFLRPWSAINGRWWSQNAPELRLASCFTQDSGSASSN